MRVMAVIGLKVCSFLHIVAIFLFPQRAEMEVVGKKISELRVVDLRQILEKRGLEKSGNKSILIERLSKSLSEEGHDPSAYTFDENEDAANESLVSDVSHVEEDMASKSEDANGLVDIVDDLENNETNDDENEDLVEEVDNVREFEEVDRDEDSSMQDGDKMVELDSITAEHTDTKEEPSVEEEAVSADSESGITKTSVRDEMEAIVDTTAQDSSVQHETETSENAQLQTGVGAVRPTQNASALSEKICDEIIADNDDGAADKPSELCEDNVDESTVSTGDKASVDTGDQLVVHVDESDTNLDYDLGEKTEERDAPTPTKDESMDVDTADIVISEGNAATTGGQSDNGATTESGSASGQTTKSSSDLCPDAPKKDAKDLAASQNLWISGLSSLTRATDLKAVFSKHGKVVGAKVVTNANRPGAKCYGYVTMSSAEEAAKCIQNLHRTELHGRMISVEKAKSDPATQARAAAAATARKPPPSADDTKKDDLAAGTAVTKDGAAKDDNRPKTESHRAHPDDKSRHNDRIRIKSTPSAAAARKEGEPPAKEGGEKKATTEADKEKKPEAVRRAEEFLEREKRKLRSQERRAREEEHRQRTTLMRDRRAFAEQQRRFRHEQQMMERERDKLRMDREKMKIEELKLESLQSERARLENQLIDIRQRVDREREELKRAETLRLDEMRRASAMKRPYESSSSSTRGAAGRYDEGWESKRPATNDRYVSLSTSDRRSGERGGGGGFSDRRGLSDMDRRSAVAVAGVKDLAVDSRSGRPDDRYSSRAGAERRDFSADSRGRDNSQRSDWKQTPSSDSRGVSRGYHEGSSRRSSGGVGSGDSRPGGSWGGGSSSSSSGAPSLLAPAAGGGEIFSGAAAVQAAGMMMSAAMNRGSATNGTSSRYGGGSGGGGYSSGRRY